MILEDAPTAAAAVAWLVRCIRSGASLPSMQMVNISPACWWVEADTVVASWSPEHLAAESTFAVNGGRLAAALAAAGEGSVELAVEDATLVLRAHRFRAALPIAEVESTQPTVEPVKDVDPKWRGWVAAAGTIAAHNDGGTDVVSVCPDGAWASCLGVGILMGEPTGDPLKVSRRGLDCLPPDLTGIAVGETLVAAGPDRQVILLGKEVSSPDFRGHAWGEELEGPVPADVVAELVERASFLAETAGHRWVRVQWADSTMTLDATADGETAELTSPVVASDSGSFYVSGRLLADVIKAVGAPCDITLLRSPAESVDPTARVLRLEGSDGTAWLQTARRP